jgi:ribokinase
MARPQVVVLGSLNIDYIARVERLPKAGQTVVASRLVRRFGGKGANQAVAAARQGAQVAFIGCVGYDESAKQYVRRLRDEGIDPGGIVAKAGSLTGTALIAVEDSAENIIVVAPEANARLSPSAVRAQAGRIQRADALLVQWEVTLGAVIEATRLANRAGVPVLMNPSPARPGFPWRDCKVDVLMLNEGEAEALFDLNSGTSDKTWSAVLKTRRLEHAIITRGMKPTICISNSSRFEVPTLDVTPVDTVGAGDAFAGCFAARWAEGADLRAAVAYANCAGALATLKSGAQESIPSRAATECAYQQL